MNFVPACVHQFTAIQEPFAAMIVIAFLRQQHQILAALREIVLTTGCGIRGADHAFAQKLLARREQSMVAIATAFPIQTGRPRELRLRFVCLSRAIEVGSGMKKHAAVNLAAIS